MFETIVFTYGLLASFVLTSTTRNHRLQRPNPPILAYAGYVLCGVSGGLSVLLLLWVAWHQSFGA